MRLFGVELTRLRWRRAVVVLIVACFLVPALIWGGLAWNTRPVGGDDLRNAQEQVERDSQEPGLQREIQRCIEHPRQYGANPADPATDCKAMLAPQVEWYLYREQLDLGKERKASGLAIITILMALVMLIGTTFVGHDWNTGSMSNQLLFEPRRLRIWSAKAAVIFLTGLVIAALALTLYWTGLWLLAGSRDLQATGHEWDLIRSSLVRGSLLIACAGVGGYALTMLFRSTVATIGVLFAVTVGGSVLIVSLLGNGAERWLLPTNVGAVLYNGYDYYGGTDVVCEGSGMDNCSGLAHLSLTHGVVYLGVMLLIAVVLSLWSFRSRDVP